MFDKQVDQLFENWDHKGTPGVAVAVVKDGKCLYKKGYGIANLEYDIPITPSTPFNAGSISKMFTAFSILLLTEEGKLSLEDDVRKYIPEVPDFGKIIRIKHLVYHTSGLREQEDLLAMAGWHFSDVRRTDHILKLISKQRGVNFNPGEKYQYCNTGYTLLAEIVKRIVDQPFSKFTEERIFAPLNMNHTLFYDNHEGIVKNRAYSYFLDERGVEYCNWPLNNSDVGARGLFTTVEDLSQWVLNFENPVVGNPEIIMQMNEPGCLNNGRRVPYAFGQEIGAHQGLNWLGHSGVDASFRAHLGRFIDQSLSVIVLSNNATFVPDVTANKVSDLYLLNKIEEKKEVFLHESEETNENTSIEIDALNAYVGEFEQSPTHILTITQEKGQLFAQATGQSKFALKSLTPMDFSIVRLDAKITFHRDHNNEINLLKIHQAGQVVEAPRLRPFDETSVELSDYIGRFYCEELATEYSLMVENSKLIATHDRWGEIYLRPIQDGIFLGDWWLLE